MSTLFANSIAANLEDAMWEIANFSNFDFGNYSVSPAESSWSTAETLCDSQYGQKQQLDGSFPLTRFMEIITPYQLQTLEAASDPNLAKTWCSRGICLGISLSNLEDTPHSGCPPTTNLKTYDLKKIRNDHPIPAPVPFLSDSLSMIIPEENFGKQVQGVMVDVVTAIRFMTVPKQDPQNPSVNSFVPPNTEDIQNAMSILWEDKYKPGCKAKEWRNTVNQCLTHGQGWNFISYEPTDGGKLKRHILFERAYNGLCILGPGQCKALNDKRKVSKSLF